MTGVPVIAIDGPAASGKGAVAQAVAERLGFHYLDSGAIYRAAALVVDRAGIAIDAYNVSEQQVAKIAREMPLSFRSGKIWMKNQDITESIRSEACGKHASKIAVFAQLRQALLQLQHDFRRPPGLVAEGRDMGTVVFPGAGLKIFLTASAQVRAARRHKQLMEKGINANINDLLVEIEARDARDYGRSVAPLKVSNETIMIDTTDMDLAQSIEAVLKFYNSNTAGKT